MKQRWVTTLLPYLLLTIAGLLMLRVAFTGDFLDEQENWTGSWLISRNLRLYADIFTHHAPLPYLIGSLLYPAAATHPEVFRYLIAGLFWGGAAYLMRLGSPRLRWALAVGMTLWALAGPTFNLQQMLASTWGAMGMMIVSWTALAVMNGDSSGWPAARLMPLGSAIAAWAAPATLPALLIQNGWYVWRIRHRRELKTYFGWLAGIHGVLLVWLLSKGSLTDAWWAVVTYNASYYAPLKLGQGAGLIQSFLQSGGAFLGMGIRHIGEATLRLGQTVYHILPQAITQPALLGVAWQAFRERLTQLPTALCGSMILAVILTGKYRGWRQAGFWLATMLALQWQHAEVFHWAPFLAVLLMIITSLLTHLVVENYRATAVILIAGLSLVGGPVIGRYLEAVRYDRPLIGPSDQAISAAINGYKISTPGVLAVNTSPVIYLSTRSLPVLRTYYVFDWIVAVPEFKDQLMQTVAARRADVVVIGQADNPAGSPWLPEFQALVAAGYTETSPGVYLKR